MEAIIKCNSEEIVKIEEKVLEAFKKQFPKDVYYTTYVTKWNDGTFQVEVRHGDGKGLLHCFLWSNGLEYWKVESLNPIIKDSDWEGNPLEIKP